MDLSSYDNTWYKPGPRWKRILWYLVNALIFDSSLFPFYRFKVLLLRLFGANIGNNVAIKPKVNIKYPWFLSIGNNVWIGERVWIDNLGQVTLGNNVCLSQGCMLLSGNHDYTRAGFDLVIKEIVLEEGVWIGASAIVCGGVLAKKLSVLSVGSVATGIMESSGIYQGVPATIVKQRKINESE